MKNIFKYLLIILLFIILGGTAFASGSPEISTPISERFGFFTILISAALGDSINPCAFAIMFILLSSILRQSKSRSKVLLSGFMFILAIFISYFAIGKGLYMTLASTVSTNILKILAGILGIIVGLANLKDYFLYGKYFKMEVPDSWRPNMKKLVTSITSPWGAFFIGFIISLFLLPCTGGPYFFMLSYLSGDKEITELWVNIYLLVYNFIFVIPMMVIALIVAFGVKDLGELKEQKELNVEKIHLITGVIMLLLGAYVLFDVLRLYV